MSKAFGLKHFVANTTEWQSSTVGYVLQAVNTFKAKKQRIKTNKQTNKKKQPLKC